MINAVRWKKTLVTFIAVLTMSMTLSSCENLRKKFTRKKKKGQVEDQNFVPVLAPVDYPAPENNSGLSYRHHYSLIKVWYKDLWTALDEKTPEKRVRYTIKQVSNHIDEMQKLLGSDKQGPLLELKNLLTYYEQSLEVPREMRNISRIRSDLRAFDRQLRQLRFDRIKTALVPSPAQPAK